MTSKWKIKKVNTLKKDDADASTVNQDLKDIGWTDNEKQMLMSIINNFGSGQHPVCEADTFDYFKTEYLIEILKTMDMDDGLTLSPKGQELVNQIKNKLQLV